MYQPNTTTSRRARKLSIRSQQLISNLYEETAESDSGLDSSGEENSHIREDDLTNLCLTPDDNNNNINYGNTMRAYTELDHNIEKLEAKIIDACNRLASAVGKRREELLQQVKEIRSEKLKTLKLEHETTTTSTATSYMMNSAFGKNDVNIGSCLRFVVDDNKVDLPLLSLISEYGYIDEGRASASKSSVHGMGLKYAIAEETTQFELTTRNNSDELSWVEQDQIDVLIKKDNMCYKCAMKNHCNGTYNISYELPESGIYEIHVKVNGRHLEESPYRCNVFEKKDVKFLDYDTEEDWTFQNGDKAALVERTDQQRTSKLYANDSSPVRAWKVRVTTACPKIKIKFGYSNNDSLLIPDLHEEYFCKFDLNELIAHDTLSSYTHHHTHGSFHRNHRRKHGGHHRTAERKQSTYHRSSLTFMIFQDTHEKLIHVGAEGTVHEKTTSFKGDIHKLIPFIGIKHFCNNTTCPRPMLVFS